MQFDTRIAEILDTASNIGEARRRIASCLEEVGLPSSERLIDSIMESAMGGDDLVVDGKDEPVDPPRRERSARLFGRSGRRSGDAIRPDD